MTAWLIVLTGWVLLAFALIVGLTVRTANIEKDIELLQDQLKDRRVKFPSRF